jgi:uncharacterized RDD family membrane protein YckC
MLCPLCGADVGKEVVLCPDCFKERQKRDAVEKIGKQTLQNSEHVYAAKEAEEQERLRAEAEARGEEYVPPVEEAIENEDEVTAEAEDDSQSFSGHAGFWLRFVSYLADSAILGLIIKLISILVFSVFFGDSLQNVFKDLLSIEPASAASGDMMAAMLMAILIPAVVYLVASIVVGWLYFALFEASKFQATPGKILLGLCVTSNDLEPIGVGQATARHFGKILSSITLVGYIAAGVTANKQAFHDMIAGTLVVRREVVGMVKVIAVLLGSLCALVLVEALPDGSRPVDKTVVPKVVGQGGLSTIPQATPTPLPPIELIESDVNGAIQIEELKIDLSASLSLFDPLTNRLQIAFFKEKLGEEVKDELAKITSLKSLVAQKPDLLIDIVFKPESTQCDKANINTYHVEVLKGAGGSEVEGRFDFSTSLDAIEELSCELERESLLSFASKRTTFKADGGERIPIRWAVESNGAIQVGPLDTKVVLLDHMALSRVAVWNPDTRVIEVGFYAQAVAPEETLMIREKKSLFALERKKPFAIVSMDIAEGRTTFARESVSKYGITIYRYPDFGIVFPGARDSVSFYYVPTEMDDPRFEKIGGQIGEQRVVTGSLANTAEKSFSNIPFSFTWDLSFNDPLLNVFADAGSIAESGIGADFKPDEFYARIRVGDLTHDLTTAVALYYPEQGDIAIGFYAQPITDEDKKVILKNRFLWAYVNGKRPNFVLFLDMEPDFTNFSREEVKILTSTFIRDKVGEFYFPGVYEQKKFERAVADLGPEELRALKGDPRAGGTISLRLRGVRDSQKSSMRFAWAVNIPEIQVLEVAPLKK